MPSTKRINLLTNYRRTYRASNIYRQLGCILSQTLQTMHKTYGVGPKYTTPHGSHSTPRRGGHSRIHTGIERSPKPMWQMQIKGTSSAPMSEEGPSTEIEGPQKQPKSHGIEENTSDNNGPDGNNTNHKSKCSRQTEPYT